jgi:hypothetical protein
MAYACRFASGAQDVTVAFRQEFPAAGRSGKPIQPGDLAMTVTIPRAGVTAMLPAGTIAVTATGDLTAHITQGGSAADADWPGLTAGATPVSGTGDLALKLTGTVPAVTVSAGGDVVFHPAALALTLRPQAAASSGGSSGGTPPAGGSASGGSAGGTGGGSAGSAGSAGSTGSTDSAGATGGSTGSGTGTASDGGAGSGTDSGTAAGSDSASGTGTGSHAAALSADAADAAGATGTAGTAGTAGSGSGSGDAAGSGSGGTTGSGSGGGADLLGDCAPAPGQDTALATVPVSGAAPGTPGPGGSASAGRTPTAGGTSPGAPGATGAGTAAGRPGTILPQDGTVHSGLTTCGKTPTGDPDPKRLPPTGSTAIVLPMPGQPAFPDAPMCGFAVGFSNVNKLNGAMIVNDPHAHPVMAEVNGGRRKVLDFTNEYVEVDSVLDLTLPPSKATFLTYGFMPTTASVEFVPKGLMTVVQSGDTFFDQPILTTIGGYQEIRVHDVRINGTPLDVGPNCRTATPVDVELKGREDDYLPGGDGKPDYDIVNGGPLIDENLVVPPFTGCRSHGEDLDALFTASLSGPGNTLNLSQGRLCDPVNVPETTCQPEIQIPQLPQRRH